MNTACVIVPPAHLWGPIEEIRRSNDKVAAKWMPHISLIAPPFAHYHALHCCVARLRESFHTARIAPFQVRLAVVEAAPPTKQKDGRVYVWARADPASEIQLSSVRRLTLDTFREPHTND